MSDVLDRLVRMVSQDGVFPLEDITVTSTLDKDLGICGDEAEDLIVLLAEEFGDWLYDWPWTRFIDLNEPGWSLGPKIWKFLKLPNPEVAFPGYTEERLEIGHIAAVIEKGEWFEP